MDQQNPKRVPTEAEIARLEAEAAAALQRGEAPSQGKVPSQGRVPSLDRVPSQDRVSSPGEEPTRVEAEAAKVPGAPGFVPYVDDVTEAPKPVKSAVPAAEIEPEDDDEDDEPYVPGPWEERVDKLTPKQWKLAQILGGAALGLIAVGLLFIGGEELATYRMILAALAALLVPRYVERVLRRELNVARRAMIVSMLVGLVAAFLFIGFRNGFDFTKAG